jgi:hypothetical protein
MLQSIRELHDNRGGRTFLIGVNELTFSMYCTMKPHDILKVKNVVVVHALRHGIQYLQF